jgi:hypothetical protein
MPVAIVGSHVDGTNKAKLANRSIIRELDFSTNSAASLNGKILNRARSSRIVN